MKKLQTWITVGLLAASAAPVLAGNGGVRIERGLTPQLVPVPVGSGDYSGLEVWTDAGEGGRVRPGEFVDVYVRASYNTYVAVVDIDTRGRARLIYPVNPRDDGFVRGGRIVAVPGPYADYRLAVSGPTGTERIVALASDRPLRDCWREALEESEGYDRVNDEYYDESDTWGASARGERLTPQLRPVPRDRGWDRGLDRAETCFQVVRRTRYHGSKY